MNWFIKFCSKNLHYHISNLFSLTFPIIDISGEALKKLPKGKIFYIRRNDSTYFKSHAEFYAVMLFCNNKFYDLRIKISDVGTLSDQFSDSYIGSDLLSKNRELFFDNFGYNCVLTRVASFDIEEEFPKSIGEIVTKDKMYFIRWIQNKILNDKDNRNDDGDDDDTFDPSPTPVGGNLINANIDKNNKLGYANEEAYLRNTLRGGVNAWDYPGLVVKYLRKKHNLIQEVEDELEFGRDWIDSANEAQILDYQNWLKNQDRGSEHYGDPYSQPVYEAMDFEEYLKPTWLVHLTDDAISIFENGFKYGHPDIEGVHLTTWKRDENRKREGGYNFAFLAGSKDLRYALNQKKYGSDAVVFFSSGVKAYHYGDEERQIIFWGPSVNVNWIFPVIRNYDDWEVKNSSLRTVYKSDDFSNCVTWIMNNYNQIQSERDWQYPKKKPSRNTSAS